MHLKRVGKVFPWLALLIVAIYWWITKNSVQSYNDQVSNMDIPQGNLSLDPLVLKAQTESIYKAMIGFGTDEETVLGLLSGKTKADLDFINQQFGVRMDTYLTANMNLAEFLESELSGADYVAAYNAVKGSSIVLVDPVIHG